MAPAVPFPLLGGVQLLAVAAALAVASAALLPRLRGQGTGLVVAGGLLLAGVDGWTAVAYTTSGQSIVSAVRALAQLTLAAGLATAALRRTAPLTLSGVVAPVGAVLPVGVLAGLSGLIAAGAALRGGVRSRHALLLSGGLLLWAAAAGLAGAVAGRPDIATWELALRGAGALLVLASVASLARVSLLGKLVGGILAGVLLMALAALTVTGLVLTRSYDGQQEAATTAVARTQADALRTLGLQAQNSAVLIARCGGRVEQCAPLLDLLSPSGESFAAVVDAAGTITQLPSSTGTPLPESTRLALAGRAVQQAREPGRGGAANTAVRLPSLGGDRVAVLGVAPSTAAPGSTPAYVGVYGVFLDDRYLTSKDPGLPGYTLSVLVDGRVVATSADDAERSRIAAAVTNAGAQLPEDGVSLAADGRSPLLRVVPIDGESAPVGQLAVALDAGAGLSGQDNALRLLFITSVLVLLVVAGLAVAVARRLVEPVRRLTAAVARVRQGDLEVSARIAGQDEIGALSRSFDAMTLSLRRGNDELRRSALQENALRSRLEAVLGSMTDALITTDVRGRLTMVNPAAVALLGLPDADSVLGEPLVEVLVTRDAAGEARPEAPGRERRVDVIRPDGSTVPVQVGVAPLEVPDMANRGSVLVLRDLTEQRRVERMKTEFLSNISHELRTPLTPIRGYAEILRKRPDLPPEKTATYAGTIVDSSARMARVVDLLVDVAALDAGNVRPQPRAVQVQELLAGCQQTWTTRAPERANDLRLRVSGQLPAVLVDPAWVVKALDEFIDNAVKYTPPETPILLVAGLVPGGGTVVRVGVRDAGPGIQEQDLDSIFAAFEQVDGSATRTVGGLGLGLSFVRRVSDTLGLALSVRSSPGVSTEFSLDLPVLPAERGGRPRLRPRRRPPVGSRPVVRRLPAR